VLRHVAFLRAINTTGRRAKNEDLCEVFTRMGASYAEGFIASGNVIFDMDRPVSQGFVDELEPAFRDTFGFEIPTIIRTADDVRSVSLFRPFPDEVINGSAGRLYVGFLKSTPEPESIKKVLADSTASDRLAIHRNELYWLSASGETESDISIPGIERTVGTMTVRVMNTVNRIVERFLTT